MIPEAEEFQKPTSTIFHYNPKSIGLRHILHPFAHATCIKVSVGLLYQKATALINAGHCHWLYQNINKPDPSCFNCTIVFSAKAERSPLYCLDWQHIDITFHQQRASIQKTEVLTNPLEAKSLVVPCVWTLRVWLMSPVAGAFFAYKCHRISKWSLRVLSVRSPPFFRDLEISAISLENRQHFIYFHLLCRICADWMAIPLMAFESHSISSLSHRSVLCCWLTETALHLQSIRISMDWTFLNISFEVLLWNGYLVWSV